MKLQPDDVVNIDGSLNLVGTQTCKASTLLEWLKTRLPDTSLHVSLVGDGAKCEVLFPDGKGWKKGKVRLSLEFIPEEIDSPLDELREKLNIE